MAVALAVKKWTLSELHRLPDDGNKYELVKGELFVTPAPTPEHEEIAARLTRVLEPYVVAHRLGFIYHPRNVVRYRGSEVEPDLVVRAPHPDPKRGWTRAPIPLLVVEIHSPYTGRRDREEKRDLYARAGVEEYWMIDPEERTLTSVRTGHATLTVAAEMRWWPTGAVAPLLFDVATVFPMGESS